MWLKWTKRIIAGIGIFVVLIIGLASAIIFLYEDEIKDYAVKQLNTHLKTEVKVGDIELTLFQQFPSASLKFSNAFIPDMNDTTAKDTMLFAESLFLNFNFWDIIDGNYTVNNLKTENAVVKLKIDSTGSENYNIWKTDTTSSNNKFSFALEAVMFEDIQLSYQNDVTDQYYQIASKEINFQGLFSESVYDLTANSEIFIHSFKNGSVSYISEKNASVDFVLNIDTDSSQYNIKHADFIVEDLAFDISGNYTNQNESSILDLLIKGKNIDLEKAFSIFPKAYFETLQQYDASGLLEFNTTISGLINKENTPKVTADFSLSNGSLTEQQTKARLTQLSFNGTFENHRSQGEKLSLSNILGRLEQGNIAGNIEIENFSKPSVDASLDGNLSLFDVSRFINSENIEKMYGDLAFSSEFKGVFNASSDAPIKIKTSNGNVHINDAFFQLKGSHITYSALNGKLSLRKNDAAFSGLQGKILSSEFKADGIIKNLLPFILTPNQTLTIETDFNSKNIDLNELLVDDKPNPKEATPLSLPENVNFNLKAQIGKLTYDQFVMDKVRGIITLHNKTLSGQNIHFKANKGDYIVSTEIEETAPNQFAWTLNAEADNIDIENFFSELDNFHQEYITNQNLKGRANIELNLATVLDGFMQLDPNKLYASANISLKKGELINQSSMIEIGKYFTSNPLVSAAVDTKTLQKKLTHIKFSELSNTITIDKGVINIPRMTIASNVMDLGISGEHRFDDVVDYHFNFRLNEVLKNKKSNEEFGPVQDDGLGVKIFLHMFGPLDNLQYKLDKEERKLQRKESIQQEKKELKSILKQEFGLFKGDSSVQSIEKEKVKPTFEVEWDEFDDPQNEEEVEENLLDEKNKKDKNKGLNKFLKKLGVEEEEKKKAQIEIDN